jgi:hypothetical protein
MLESAAPVIRGSHLPACSHGAVQVFDCPGLDFSSIRFPLCPPRLKQRKVRRIRGQPNHGGRARARFPRCHARAALRNCPTLPWRPPARRGANSVHKRYQPPASLPRLRGPSWFRPHPSRLNSPPRLTAHNFSARLRQRVLPARHGQTAA